MNWDMQQFTDVFGPRRQYRKIIEEEDNYTSYHDEVSSIEQADLVTSHSSIEGYHLPVLDLDFRAYLIPSSTHGHYHLYMDRPVPWRKYKKLLKALYRAGIIEYGFYKNSIKRGYTSARLPWISKYDTIKEASF